MTCGLISLRPEGVTEPVKIEILFPSSSLAWTWDQQLGDLLLEDRDRAKF